MQELHRVDDWRARLAAEMDSQRRDPFEWGKHDCAIGFAARIVHALTGIDLAHDYHGTYASPRGALRVIKEAGADSLSGFVSGLLPEVHPSMANVGYIGVVASHGPLGEALAMIDVSRLVVMTDHGHGHLPRSELIRAFKVG